MTDIKKHLQDCLAEAARKKAEKAAQRETRLARIRKENLALKECVETTCLSILKNYKEELIEVGIETDLGNGGGENLTRHSLLITYEGKLHKYAIEYHHQEDSIGEIKITTTYGTLEGKTHYTHPIPEGEIRHQLNALLKNIITED